jgi:predicted RND superfamily exporter protein
VYTERVGKFTTRYPWIGIMAILVITAGAVLSMVMFPMEESFNNEDFLPDIDVARANSLYSETFTSTYPFLVLVRSDDGDIVEPDDFRDLALLSGQLTESGTYKEWKDEGSSSGPSSPALAMYDIMNGVDSAEEIVSSGQAIESYIQITTTVNSTSSSLLEFLEVSSGTKEQNLSLLLENLGSDIDTLLSTVEVPSSSQSQFDGPVQYFESFDTVQEFKDEVVLLLGYDINNVTIQDSIMNLNIYSAVGKDTADSLERSKEEINELLERKDISRNLTDELKELNEEIGEAIALLDDVVGISEVRGNPLVFGQIAQDVSLGKFFLTNFLTEDFDPSSGFVEAKGGMVLANLDYRLYNMEEEGDLDILLDIEGNLSAIVSEFDEDTDSSFRPIASARINQRINEASNESMQILLPLAMVFVFVILFFIYRSLIDITLNVIALVFAIIWMYGFGSLMGYSSNPMITAVPVLLVGLGIDYGIHLTMRYREEIRKGKEVKEALTAMSASVGMALLLATFTTVFAFLSNLSSPVGLILQFGVMAAV